MKNFVKAESGLKIHLVSNPGTLAGPDNMSQRNLNNTKLIQVEYNEHTLISKQIFSFFSLLVYTIIALF